PEGTSYFDFVLRTSNFELRTSNLEPRTSNLEPTAVPYRSLSPWGGVGVSAAIQPASSRSRATNRSADGGTSSPCTGTNSLTKLRASAGSCSARCGGTVIHAPVSSQSGSGGADGFESAPESLAKNCSSRVS